MNPQAVTVGARLGRRLNLVILAAARPAAARSSFFGGLLASIIGGISGSIGPQTTAELIRIALARLEQQPQLALPPGVATTIIAGTTAKSDDPEEAKLAELFLTLRVLVYEHNRARLDPKGAPLNQETERAALAALDELAIRLHE